MGRTALRAGRTGGMGPEDEPVGLGLRSNPPLRAQAIGGGPRPLRAGKMRGPPVAAVPHPTAPYRITRHAGGWARGSVGLRHPQGTMTPADSIERYTMHHVGAALVPGSPRSQRVLKFARFGHISSGTGVRSQHVGRRNNRKETRVTPDGPCTASARPFDASPRSSARS